MPWSWVNTEYSIHQVLHHPKFDSLPLAASFSSLGRCCCTQLCTFPQLRVNQWIESQLPLRLPPNLPPPSTPPILIYHGLQVYLWTCSISASMCISNLVRSRPPSASLSSLDHSLQLYHHTRSIMASKCISEVTQTCPPVHLWTRSITATKCISKLDHGLVIHLWVHMIPVCKCISNLVRSRPPSTSLKSNGGCTEIPG